MGRITGPASFLGLAPAAGFASGASVVGTVRGDGMGWLARRHGLAAAGVRTVEFVTPDGELERGDELPRGGVITALEIDLHPADDLYAGALFFSPGRAAEVLKAWLAWTATAPPEITSVARIMRFGTGHEVAEMVRGRSFVVVEAAHLGREAEGAALLEPLRELRAELDTFRWCRRRHSATCTWSPRSRRAAGQRRAPPCRRRPLLHARVGHPDRRSVERGDRGAARARRRPLEPYAVG